MCKQIYKAGNKMVSEYSCTGSNNNNTQKKRKPNVMWMQTNACTDRYENRIKPV